MMQTFSMYLFASLFQRKYIMFAVETIFIAYSIVRIITAKEKETTPNVQGIIYYSMQYAVIMILQTHICFLQKARASNQESMLITMSTDITHIADELSEGILIETSKKPLYYNKSFELLFKLSQGNRLLSEHIRLFQDKYLPNLKQQIIQIDGICLQCYSINIVYQTQQSTLHIITDITKKENGFNCCTNKELFFSMCTHELRSPLNTIKLFLSSLKESLYNGNSNDEIDNAINACSFQESLIDDILDYIKVENGHLNLSMDFIDYRHFAKSIICLIKLQCKYKGIKIKKYTDEAFPLKFYCDERRMKQVLLNLLSNSIKFTLTGGQITISAYKGKESLLISVSDTGVGISASDINNLFKPFGVAQSNQQMNKGGTGFGLYLCKMLIEKMGGSISVNSFEGLGTTFSILMPLKEYEDAEPERLMGVNPKISDVGRPSMATLSIKMPHIDHISTKYKDKNFSRPSLRIDLDFDKSKVLIVDDEPMCLFALRMILEKNGVSVLSSTNVPDACNIVENVNDIMLAFIDINLGVSTGYTLVEKLMGIAKYIEKSFPLVAITGEDTNAIKEKCLSKGFSEVVRKPVDVGQIHLILEKYNIE
jgi:signal transduction histidine kinase/CheY-like chemotaxis protein